MSTETTGIHHVTLAVDEEPEHLGENLKLPSWFEEVLPPLHVPTVGRK
jgi:hypothetical protein